MPTDINNPKFKQLAAAILQRHESGDAEANITSAIRDFLIESALAKSDEIIEENPPSDVSRRAVDLTALDTFIEVKRRVSNMQAGFDPNPEYVQQIDDYLALSANEGKGVRTGILTDGKHWLLRRHGAGAVRTTAPYGASHCTMPKAGLPSTSGCAIPLWSRLKTSPLTEQDCEIYSTVC